MGDQPHLTVSECPPMVTRRLCLSATSSALHGQRRYINHYVDLTLVDKSKPTPSMVGRVCFAFSIFRELVEVPSHSVEEGGLP